MLAENSAEEIQSTLRQAVCLVDHGKAPEAVLKVQELHRVGQSFASKIVRFLCPKDAVILDEVIRTALGFEENRDGYAEFLGECREIYNFANKSLSKLRVCDVETAIFAKIKGYSNADE